MQEQLGSNGVADREAAADALIGDDEIVVGIRRRIAHRKEHIEALQAQIDPMLAQMKRDERALALLTGEERAKPGLKPGPKPKGDRVRDNPSRVGDERLAQIRETIAAFAADHEEFRQVDIRTITGLTSSNMATAFEMLRQQNVIRFARQDGNNKYYRLTRVEASA
jgi:hypothetical protein